MERTIPRLLKMQTRLCTRELCHLDYTTRSLTFSKMLTYVRLKAWSFPNFAVLADPLSHYQNLGGLALSSTVVAVCWEVGHTAKLGTHEAVVREGGDVDSTRRCSFEVLTIDYVDFGSLGHWLLSQRSTIEIKGLRESPCRSLSRCYRLCSVPVHSFDLSQNSGLRSIHLRLRPLTHNCLGTDSHL
jgi:hypothetical protein